MKTNGIILLILATVLMLCVVSYNRIPKIKAEPQQMINPAFNGTPFRFPTTTPPAQTIPLTTTTPYSETPPVKQVQQTIPENTVNPSNCYKFMDGKEYCY
jgi:hypothetical protein